MEPTDPGLELLLPIPNGWIASGFIVPGIRAALMSLLLKGGSSRKAMTRMAAVASMPTSPKVQPVSAARGRRRVRHPSLRATKFSRSKTAAAAVSQMSVKSVRPGLVSLMISTARMVPEGSSATSPLRRKNTHQLVHSPVATNISSRLISRSVLVRFGSARSHVLIAGSAPPEVSGDGVRSARLPNTARPDMAAYARRDARAIAKIHPSPVAIARAGTSRPSVSGTQAERSTAIATAQPMSSTNPSSSQVSRKSTVSSTRLARKSRIVRQPPS